MSVDSLIRRIPHFKGKFRLVRSVFKKKLSVAKDVVLKGRFNLQYRVPNLKENIGFELFADGIYEPETIKLIVEKIPPGGTFLDIGANIGSIAIPVCKLRPDIKAICVEASPKVFDYLQSNIAINKLENCISINKIISDNDGAETDFFTPDELFGKGSMSPAFTTISEKMQTISIDALMAQYNISKLHLIKIDIEGYEWFAFKGGEKLLKRADAPDILFEYLDCAESLTRDLTSGDAQSLLIGYGYDLYTIDKQNTITKIEKPLLEGEAMMFATKKAPTN